MNYMQLNTALAECADVTIISLIHEETQIDLELKNKIFWCARPNPTGHHTASPSKQKLDF